MSRKKWKEKNLIFEKLESRNWLKIEIKIIQAYKKQKYNANYDTIRWKEVINIKKKKFKMMSIECAHK